MSARQERITAQLGSNVNWGPITCVASTGSTNADVAQWGRQGRPGGAVLVAQQQTAGRGRFDRRWETPAAGAVAMSVLIEPDRPLAQWGWLPLLAGMAVVDALPGVPAELKWPNDVLLHGGKICGILSEAVPRPNGTMSAVIGIGINIAVSTKDLPTEAATSLSLHGITVDEDALIGDILTQLARRLEQWESGDDIRSAYQKMCATIGREIWLQQSETVGAQGTAVGVDADGHLLVTTSQGQQAFASGDVVHLRLQDDGGHGNSPT